MTTSLHGALIGSQTPRVESVPVSVTSAGAEAADLAELAGLRLDPWQRYVLDRALGQRADGRWSAFEVGLIVPRQNGKGGVIEALELAALFLHDVPITHTAHLMKTSKDAFKRIWSLISETPDLRKRVRKIRTANEEHSIETRSGALLTFMVRSGKSGRGLSDGDLIILDEALFLDPEQMAALVPMMSTKPNPQLWYTSSAGVEGSERLRAIRARGVAGEDPRLAYFEWSVPEPEPGFELDVDDEALWALANPAMGIRISADYIRSERGILGEQFARERLGVFDDPGVEGRVIGAREWAALADEGSVLVGTPVMALDCPPEQSSATIAAAGRNGDGLVHVELVENRSGLGWVVERCVGLHESHEPAAWLIDPSGPASALVTDLQSAGIPLTFVTGRDYAGACGALLAEVRAGVAGGLRHLGDPVLAQAVAAGRRRDVGDGGWAWGRKNSEVNIAPLVAVTLAHHGAAGMSDPLDNIW